MNELRVVRGTDISLFAEDTPLFGITAFSAEEKPLFHEVHEYLNVKPCKRVPQGAEYVIRIGMMSLFDHQLPAEEAFTLRLVDDDVTYRYDNCRIIGRTTRAEGNRTTTEEFTLKAENMVKQVTENE